MSINVGQAIAYLDLDTTAYNRGLKTACDALSDFGNSALSIGSKIQGLGGAMSGLGKTLSLGVTAPLITLGGVCVKLGTDLDTTTRKVMTIADAAVLSMDTVKKQVVSMSNELGVSAGELNEGLYAVISATGDTANAVGYLDVASKAAVGGFTTSAIAVDGLTTVLNAYGLKGGEAIRTVSDQMLMAQNYGKTTFGELAGSIGNVIPLAATLKVGTNELFGSLAVLTKQGIGTSEAVTGLKATFANILKPGAESAKTAKKLGIDLSAAGLASKGLSGFLADLAEKTGGSTEKMGQLFPSVEALNTVLAMTSATGRTEMAGAMSAMADSAGATDAAFETMSGGVQGSMNRVKQQVTNLGATFGDIMLPVVEDGLGLISDWLAAFQALNPETQLTILRIAGVAAAIGPLLLVGGKLVTLCGSLIGVMSGPAGWIALGVAGVAALTAGIIKLREASDAAADGLERSVRNVNAGEIEAIDKAFADFEADVSGKVNITLTTNAPTAAEGAVTELRTALAEMNILGDDQDKILAHISGALDPVKAALSALGLPDDLIPGITATYAAAKQKLETDLDGWDVLDDSTRDALVALVGEDEKTIREAVEKMKLPNETAEGVIASLVGVSKLLSDGVSGQTVVDPMALLELGKRIIADKSAMIAWLESFGLTTAQATQIAGLINAANAAVSQDVKPMYDDIYAKLTDGVPDTEAQTAELTTKIQTYYDDLINGVTLDTQTKRAELQAQLDAGLINSEEYDTKVATLVEGEASLIASLASTRDDTIAYVTEMSGKSTSACAASLGELQALEKRAEEATANVRAQTAAAREAIETDEMLVRYGVTSAPETVANAFTSTRARYDSGIGSARATAEEKTGAAKRRWSSAIDAANMQPTAADREAATAAANAAYEQTITAIQAELAGKESEAQETLKASILALFSGLAKQDPALTAQLTEILKQLELPDFVETLLEKINDPANTVPLTEDEKGALMQYLMGTIEEVASTEELDKKLSDPAWQAGITSFLQGKAAELSQLATDQLANIDTGTSGAWLMKLIESGLLDGSGIDTETISGQISTLLGGVDMPKMVGDALSESESGTTIDPIAPVTQAINDGAPRLKSAASDAAKGANTAMSDSKSGATTAGNALADGYIDGMRDRIDQVTGMARYLGRLGVEGINAGQQSHSPSKLAFRSGGWLGEGYVLGIEALMPRARAAAARLINATALATRPAFALGLSTETTRAQPYAAIPSTQSAASSGYAPVFNITLPNATIRNADDARVLAKSVADYIGRINAGRGDTWQT